MPMIPFSVDYFTDFAMSAIFWFVFFKYPSVMKVMFFIPFIGLFPG